MGKFHYSTAGMKRVDLTQTSQCPVPSPPQLTPLNNFFFNLPNPRIISGKFNQYVFVYVYSNVLDALQSLFVVF